MSYEQQKIITMLDYLQDIFDLENPMILDDDRAEAFDSWLVKKVEQYEITPAEDSDGSEELFNYYMSREDHE